LDQELSVDKAIEPDNILWQNLRFYSGTNAKRSGIVKVIAVLVGISSIFSGVLIDALNKHYSDLNPDLQCPDSVTKDEAFEDF